RPRRNAGRRFRYGCQDWGWFLARQERPACQHLVLQRHPVTAECVSVPTDILLRRPGWYGKQLVLLRAAGAILQARQGEQTLDLRRQRATELRDTAGDRSRGRRQRSTGVLSQARKDGGQCRRRFLSRFQYASCAGGAGKQGTARLGQSGEKVV